MRVRRISLSRVFTTTCALFVFALATSLVAGSARTQTPAFPGPADIESYRNVVERVLLTDRGGTTPGYAACVMCHTWQTSVRFSLETPATDKGWTLEQSRRNFDVVTKLVNTAEPESSRLLRKPLIAQAGGLGHTGGTYWESRTAPEYLALLKWIQSLPKDRYVAAAESTLDFDFFRACVQRVFAVPLEGHIRCSNCHSAGLIGFAPAPQSGTRGLTQKRSGRSRPSPGWSPPGIPSRAAFC